MALNIRRLLAWCAALAAVLLAASCGGVKAVDAAHAVRLAAPQMLSAGAKTVSGAPVGIFVTWTRVDNAEGYYLYRDTQPIPDPNPDGVIDPALRVNGGSQIAQPPSGSTVTFNDIFAVVIGQTYYYRVTAVDDLDQEGYASNEMSWMVHAHNVAGFSPPSVYWGDVLTITGDTFGAFIALTDSVQFPAIGGGSVAGIIQQSTDWTDTQIVVTVPAGSVTGKVSVVVNGVIAQTDTDLVILNPFISSITPAVGFVEQDLQIDGGNYGITQDTSTVSIGGVDVSAAVTSWADGVIHLTVPDGTVAGDVVIEVGGHLSNSVLFTPRAEILSASLTSAQAGEPLTLTGRYFGATQGHVWIDGTVNQTITDWTDTSISFTLSGDVGPVMIMVETADAVQSNDWSFTIVDALAVTIGGLDPLQVYRQDNVPVITADTAPDAEEVTLFIDGAQVGTPFAPPFGGIELPVAALTNGTHVVHLEVRRRAVTAQSADVTVWVYSLIGDINGDGVVDSADRDALVPLLGLNQFDLEYRPWYDTDSDGFITEADLSAVGYGFLDQIGSL